MGSQLPPDYLKLAETARAVNAERVLALTATATPSVVADILAAFHIPPQAAVVTGFYRPNLRLAVTAVEEGNRDAVLLKRLQSRKPGPTIVYVTLQKQRSAWRVRWKPPASRPEPITRAWKARRAALSRTGG